MSKELSKLETIGISVGIAIPALLIAWWAGSGYVEFKDRLEILEKHAQMHEDFISRYEKSQAKDNLVNERVVEIDKDVEWLKYHHHHQNGEGRPHVD